MKQEYREDAFTKKLESRTARIPSSAYLAAAIGSMGASAVMKVAGKDHAALFIGQWAPAFLILGLYNKLVKQLGSEGVSPIQRAM